MVPLVVGVLRNCKKRMGRRFQKRESIHLEVAKARVFAEYINEIQPGAESIEINQWPDGESYQSFLEQFQEKYRIRF